MWMLRGCQCTVACMGLRSVCQSIMHACMHACSAYEPMKTCMCATTKMDRCMQPSIGTYISISYMMDEGKLAVMKANYRSARRLHT